MNKIIAIDLTFLNDEKHNSNIFLITVPMGTEIDFVKNEIITMHAILDNREDDVLDESFGRCETCSHYGNCNYCSDCDEGSEYEYYRETVYGKNGRLKRLWKSATSTMFSCSVTKSGQTL